jgi:hypothetical protein
MDGWDIYGIWVVVGDVNVVQIFSSSKGLSSLRWMLGYGKRWMVGLTRFFNWCVGDVGGFGLAYLTCTISAMQCVLCGYAVLGKYISDLLGASRYGSRVRICHMLLATYVAFQHHNFF